MCRGGRYTAAYALIAASIAPEPSPTTTAARQERRPDRRQREPREPAGDEPRRDREHAPHPQRRRDTACEHAGGDVAGDVSGERRPHRRLRQREGRAQRRPRHAEDRVGKAQAQEGDVGEQDESGRRHSRRVTVRTVPCGGPPEPSLERLRAPGDPTDRRTSGREVDCFVELTSPT